tara:strand:+ start:144 stop:560 length:417 start_codon:yes stop_codon:yes gene_type:complete
LKKENNENNDVSVKSWLPELTMEDKKNASEESDWAKMFIATYRPGDFHTMPNGVTLQAIAYDTVRCVRIHDNPRSWWCLSMLKETFEKAQITLQLDPYTIVTQLTERAEGKPPTTGNDSTDENVSARQITENPGVEVV